MKKGSAAAKAWGRKMKALRTGISRRVSRKRKVKVRRIRHSRGVSMARKRRFSHKRGMLGGSGVGGLAKSALIGIGTAHLAGYVPINVPFKEELAGAAGAYLIGGKNIKSAAVGGIAVYLTKMMQNGGIAGVTSGNAVTGY